jgi:hypothetical protein
LILRSIPPLRTLPKTVEAACYNRVRLALKRLGYPLRVELGRPSLVMILEERLWAGVAPWDESLPMLVWSDFDVQGRDALHRPVVCRVHLYHSHAGLMMGPALEVLSEKLARRLSPVPPAP